MLTERYRHLYQNRRKVAERFEYNELTGHKSLSGLGPAIYLLTALRKSTV